MFNVNLFLLKFEEEKKKRSFLYSEGGSEIAIISLISIPKEMHAITTKLPASPSPYRFDKNLGSLFAKIRECKG